MVRFKNAVTIKLYSRPLPSWQGGLKGRENENSCDVDVVVIHEGYVNLILSNSFIILVDCSLPRHSEPDG